MKKLHLILVLLFSIALFQSCKKDATTTDTNFQKVAPKIPPSKTFIMPLNAFEDLDSLTNDDTATTRGPESYQNIWHASTNILFWSTVVNAHTAIPFASYAEAFNHEPVDQGNGVFTWSYDLEILGDDYFFVLTGAYLNNSDDVEWTMKASKDGGFSDVTWYSGIVAEDHSVGTWTLNRRPQDPETFLLIEYTASANDDFSIRYTNIIPNNDNNGDYIEFKTQDNSDFDRVYDVFRIQDNNLLEIQWKESTKEGRVKNPDHFNDAEWHCWDDDQKDTSC